MASADPLSMMNGAAGGSNGEPMTGFYGDLEQQQFDRKVEKVAKKKLVDAIQQVTAAWREVINSAWEYKEQVFGRDAQEAWDFFGSDHQFLFDPRDSRCMFNGGKNKSIDAAVPGFAMTYNIVAELVQIFGPAIYHRNPNRQAVPVLPLEPRREYYVDPVVELQCAKLEQQLNQAIQQLAAPMVEQLTQQGVEPQAAQQQAMQYAMQDPRLTPLGQAYQQCEEQVALGTQRYENAVAMQMRKLNRAYTAADIQERLLNYGPEITDLRQECRTVVDEALIKGHGIWSTELEVTPDGAQYVVASRRIPIDDWLCDKDFGSEKESQWIAVRCVEPVWKVADRWGYRKNGIRGNLSSALAAEKPKDADDLMPTELAAGRSSAWRPAGYAASDDSGKATNDLLVYWKLYSKMGLGHRLKGVKDEDIAAVLEQFGDHCMVLITDTLDHPINLHPSDIDEKEHDDLLLSMGWPTPYWKIGEWPTTSLKFHWQDEVYGMSHIKPGIGELKFLDFAMSHLANKIRTGSEDIIGVLKAAGDEAKKAFSATSVNGRKIFEVEAHWGKSVAEVFSYFQAPNVSSDWWTIVAAVAQRLDKRLGLTEMAYGLSTTQSRSALDAKQKQDNFSVRPDDMANSVEEAATKLARKEAFAMLYHYEPSDVLPALGEAATEIWQEVFGEADPAAVIRSYDYTIEAGSIRRPNKDRENENANFLTQAFLPVISAYSMGTMDFDPLNWYARQVLNKAYNIDTTGLKFQNPQQNMSPEQQQQMQIQAMIAQLNLQAALEQSKGMVLKGQLIQAEMQAKLNEGDMEAAQKVQELRQKYEEHLQNLEIALEKAKQQMAIDAAEHRQEMRQDAESFQIVKAKNQLAAQSGGRPQRMVGYKSGERSYR